jgi:hypothetical protein
MATGRKGGGLSLKTIPAQSSIGTYRLNIFTLNIVALNIITLHNESLSTTP